jgi:hypothetical protein
VQTRDMRPLPGGYGLGSSTLSQWILSSMQTEKAKTGKGVRSLEHLSAAMHMRHTNALGSRTPPSVHPIFFPAVSYPPAFGEPPAAQTRDLRHLPFGYGQGSGTLGKLAGP